MIKFLTAGESHGKALSIIVEGFPSNIIISKDEIDYQLKRRQKGYGRGNRMKIENDNIQILSGIRYGKTLGSPISFVIENKDWENWTDRMSEIQLEVAAERIDVPRPGHADLVGVSKYNFNDIRNSIERSSARETAARVAACSVARIFLKEFDIKIGSYVESVGGVFQDEIKYSEIIENKFNNDKLFDLSNKADKSCLRLLDNAQETKIISKIEEEKSKGDTLGGTFVVFATGVPVGLGSFMQFDRKLDSEITSSIMSINAIKGVEIGNGFNSALITGSMNNDIITFEEEKFSRKTNYSGGVEGGISNGMPIVLRAAMKPISTLANPIETISLKRMETVTSRWERSDFTAVPACSVIAESMLCWSLAKLFLIKFGGDSIEETKDNYFNYTSKLLARIKKNFE